MGDAGHVVMSRSVGSALAVWRGENLYVCFAFDESFDDVEIVRLKARPLKPTKTSLRIPAGGARLVLVEVPAVDGLALDIDGTPLMQMMVFGANGMVVEQLHPLRVVRIAAAAGSPLQVLVTNEGISSSVFTLSCRADPLDQ